MSETQATALAPTRGASAPTASLWIALACASFVTALVVHLAGGPIVTDDLWWHLKMGEAYLALGLWPDADPLLHTAHADAPVQHEWLFGVGVHLINQLSGLHGLRVLHAIAAAAIAGLVFRTARRSTESAALAAFALLVFLAVSWLRLHQLRPDLFSIPATLLIYGWLLAPPDGPSRGRIVAGTLLFAIWVNVHSLFAVGLLLLGAGCGAAFLAQQWERARRLGIALGAGCAITLLNPRGFEQHLTFFTSSRESAIWLIRDEWTPFAPWNMTGYGWSVSGLGWLLTTAMLLFWIPAAYRTLRSLRSQPPVDVVLLAISAAAIVAFSVSIRFLWLSLFPWLVVLRSLAPVFARHKKWVGWGLATASLATAVAFPLQAGYQTFARGHWRLSAGEYLRTPYHPTKYYPELDAFLSATRLEGNLFNPYTLGGYLAYRHAPRLRTFVDGRTEHYPADVLREYFRVNMQRGFREGESDVDLLNRRNVDVFIGVGIPTGGPRSSDLAHYTTANLERAPGWRLISRSFRHAVYLRDHEKNRENFARVAAYYAAQDVPFDPAHGLDVGRVTRERPDWASRHGLLPENFAELRERSESGSAQDRFIAMGSLARFLALAGAYEDQIALERRAIGLRPKAERPHQRLIFGLLHLDRGKEALAVANQLASLPPVEARSALFIRAARNYDRRQSPPGLPLSAWVNNLPFVARGPVPTY